MNGLITVDIGTIRSSIGGELENSVTVQAYRALIAGKTKRAQKLLANLHYETLWTGQYNEETLRRIRAVYESRNMDFPDNIHLIDKKIAWDAVTVRASDHLAMAMSVLNEGIKNPPVVIPVNGEWWLQNGYNRVSMLIAMGVREVAVEVKKSDG